MAGFISQLIMFEFLMIGMLTMYGFTSGAIDVQPTIAAITGNWPTVGTATCTFSAAGPTGSCTIVDTAFLGAIWIFASIGSILYRIGAFGYLLLQLVTVLGSVTGVPLLGYVFVAFQVILALFALGVFTRSHPQL